MESRQERLNSIYKELEKELTLLGVTAVEDQLQEGVAEAMTALRMAGIRLWVLTGKLYSSVALGAVCRHGRRCVVRKAQCSLAPASLYLIGDKVQTAINISLSAGHFTRRTVQLTLVDMATGADCKERLEEHLCTATQSRERKLLLPSGNTYGSFNPSS